MEAFCWRTEIACGKHPEPEGLSREGHTKRIQKERGLLRGGVGEAAY